MAIILRLDRVMADRKISLNELAERVGISNVNLSNLKTGKVRAYAGSLTASREIFLNSLRMTLPDFLCSVV